MNHLEKDDVTSPLFYDSVYYASMDLRYLNNIHSGRVKAIQKLLPFIAGKKTLDVGCGGGGLTNVYYRVTKDLLGIDFSANAIEFSKMRYPHLNVKVVNAFSLKEVFPDEKFEVVIANDIIEHTEDHDAFLENCKSVLEEDGYLIIGTDLDDTPGSRYIILKLFRLVLLLFGIDGIKLIMLRILELPRDKIRDYHENHVGTLSQEDLLLKLQQHGFKVEKRVLCNTVHGYIRDFILKLFKLLTTLEVRDHQLVLARRVS